jgi:hypothetical protein
VAAVVVVEWAAAGERVGEEGEEDEDGAPPRRGASSVSEWSDSIVFVFDERSLPAERRREIKSAPPFLLFFWTKIEGVKGYFVAHKKKSMQ